MKKCSVSRLALMAGLLAMGACAQAFFDPTIAISKALGSSSLSIHYTGAHVRTIEFDINGRSVSTRTLDPTSASGDAYFSIDPASLQDGPNQVEIKLYDAAGKLIGTKKTTVTAGSEANVPFFLSNPKMGETVQGAVKISVGMTSNFASPYVSFFVDNKLRSFSNNPPFQFYWDTTRESNGWHTVQSWLVDSSSTYKTQVTKVFVNNPGGLTPRESQPEPAKAKSSATPAAKPAAVPAVKPVIKQVVPATPVKPALQPVLKTQSLPTVLKPAVKPVLKNLVPFEGLLTLNPVKDSLSGSLLSLKPVQVSAPMAAGPRHQVPSVPLTMSLAGKTAVNVPAALALVTVTNGTRIGYAGTFSILLNGAIIPFDVQPRVDEGIPMTPIRYLIEHDGGKVSWDNLKKTVTASDEGISLWLQIGNPNATVNSKQLSLEKAPYIDGSRTIVPLSFIHDALHVDVKYDKTTNHVLITTKQ